MNKFIDSHTHIYKEYYDDIPSLMLEINKYCKYVINNAVDIKTSKEILELCNVYPNMFAAIGIHPEDVDSIEDNSFDYLINNLHNSKVVAIGEIGLDYHYEGYGKEKQINLFKKELDIAKEYNLPVIIHSRDATEDTIKILKSYKLKGVIHSFSGSLETAKEYLKMGYKLGINGVVTFKNAHIKDVIKELGINNFVLETDAPYLTPHPYRGEKNDSTKISVIIDFLSEYLNISKDEIVDITNRNVCEIFDKIK